MGTETVAGTRIVIHFDSERCIHARHCVLGRPDVFVPNAPGEWIHPDEAPVEELAALVRNCPSGALHYDRLDGGAEEAPPVVNTVRVRENGPLAFNGPMQIDGQDAGLRATLCRCGASQHKPYCDGSHTGAGFASSGEAAAQDSSPLAARDGVLAITPTHNGPLKIVGNLEVVTGTGKTINRGTEFWLCRCGHSKNKPYCDGSHKAAGFVSD